MSKPAPTPDPIQIGVSVNAAGAVIVMLQRHKDGSVTVIYNGEHPLGDSCGIVRPVAPPEYKTITNHNGKVTGVQLMNEIPNQPHWRVAEFWSSASPGDKVLCLGQAGDLTTWPQRKDFIRWVDDPFEV